MSEFIQNCGMSQGGNSPPYGSPLNTNQGGPDSLEAIQSISFIVLGNKFDKVRELAGERGDDWQRLIRVMENRINAWCQV